MKKLEVFHPKLITERFFPKEIDIPQCINEGRCFMWAYFGHQVFKEIELWCTGVHAFVKHNEKFYDSEVLHGAKDLMELPANKLYEESRWFQNPHQHTEESFRNEWSGQTYRFQTSWEEMNERVRKFLLKQ